MSKTKKKKKNKQPKTQEQLLAIKTKTKNKRKLRRQKRVEKIIKAITKYEHVVLLCTCPNVTISKTTLNFISSDFKTSRIFWGDNKNMARALNRTTNDDVENQLHLVSKAINGSCGLLMTNRDIPYVVQYFKDYKDFEYAREGYVAPKDVILPEGPIEDLIHTAAPRLQSLGVPVVLKEKVVHIAQEYQVCKKGDTLTAEQARILKLLKMYLADIKILAKCHWTKGRGFYTHFDFPVDNKNDDMDDNSVLEDEAEEDDDMFEDDTTVKNLYTAF